MKPDELLPIIDHIPFVVFRLSHKEDNWRTRFVNKNISMYGYTVEEFMSGEVTWFNLVHPDDRVTLSKTISDYEAHNINSFRLYYRLLKKNGDCVPVTEYNTVHRDEAGNIIFYDTTITNNTQGESSRQLIKDHYRQQIVLNDILISLHDSDLDHALQIILDRTGEYLNTSRALLFKDSPDHLTCSILHEWCNQDIKSVMTLRYCITYETEMPEIYEALQNNGNLIINYGAIPKNCKAIFAAQGLIASAIFAVYLEGEHYGFVSFDDCVVERSWDEDTVRFLKNIVNLISTVIARQSAANRLEQNRKAYEAVLDNVDSYVFVTESESLDLIFANRAFRKTFTEDYSGRNVNDFFDLTAAINAAAPHRKCGLSDYPETFSSLSGEWLAISSEEITWVDGRTVRLFNCYDVTAKKHFFETLEEKIGERTHELRLMTEKAEEEKKRAEHAANAKSMFLANMSHEMRTPLNAIIGMTNIYKAALTEERKDYCLEKIEEASVHLLGVINDILDMSKIEAGKMEIYLAEFDLKKLLVQVTNVLNYSISQKEQQFSVELDKHLPAYIVSDEQRIAQVIINLLSNAVKFTPPRGQISLSVHLAAETAACYTIEVTVRDSGIGIAKEQQKRLFQTFEQADAGISRKYGGTGLGLAISGSIAKSLDGGIKVISELNQGACFIFTFQAGKTPLPGRRDAGQRRRPDRTFDDAAGLRQKSLAKYCLLLVEDVEINREIVLALLEPTGIKIDCAATGLEAVTQFNQNSDKYDLIFMDIHMPEMDGYEAAKQIRAMDKPKAKAIPIIAMTANVFREDIEKCFSCGMNEHVGKPIDINAVFRILAKYLN